MKFIAIPPNIREDKMPNIYGIGNYGEASKLTSLWSSAQIGLPPFYKITGYEDGKLQLEELMEGTQEFNYVLKWVGPTEFDDKGHISTQRYRMILNCPESKSNMTLNQVVDLFSN